MPSEEILVREASPSDVHDVLEITRNVWEGNDYVPYVWDRWIADGRGHLTVGMRDGVLCGLMHIEVQPDGTAWAEGIRVREDLQSRGIGKALLEEGIRWAREARCPRLRLSTYGANPASNRLAEKAGLTRVAVMKAFRCEPATKPGTHASRQAVAADMGELCRVVSDHGGSLGGLYTEGWTAYGLDRARLALLVACQGILVSPAGPSKGVAIATCRPGRPVLRLGFLKGDAEAQLGLLEALVTRAAEAGMTRIQAVLQVEPVSRQALESVGFENRDDDEMLVYELELKD
jgi:GNAT superfamily N-acetyltransferase